MHYGKAHRGQFCYGYIFDNDNLFHPVEIFVNISSFIKPFLHVNPALIAKVAEKIEKHGSNSV